MGLPRKRKGSLNSTWEKDKGFERVDGDPRRKKKKEDHSANQSKVDRWEHQTQPNFFCQKRGRRRGEEEALAGRSERQKQN